MALYSIQLRPGASPDDAILVGDGFCWAAFFLGPLWAAAKGLWLAGAGLMALLAMAGLASQALHLPGSAVAALEAAALFLFAAEARRIERWSLQRRGYREVGLIAGSTPATAELDYFSRLPGRAVPAGPASAFAQADVASHDPLGLFGRM